MITVMLPTETSYLENCPMNFTDNLQGNGILEKLNIQRQSGKFCDVVLYVENTKFYLHRNILSSFSPYFESVFESKKIIKEAFNVICHNSEIFQTFVNYMYTGRVVIDRNNVTETFQLAHHLEVVRLKFYCAEYLEKYLDLNNCLTVKEMADKYDMPLLSKHAMNFIHKNLNEILNSSEFLQLGVTELKKLLFDKDVNLSQIRIFQLIINWAKHDTEKREKQLKEILGSIKWPEMNVQDLNDVLDNENFFVISESSLHLILTILQNNDIHFPKFQSIFITLNKKYGSIQQETELSKIDPAFKLKVKKRKLKKSKRMFRANPISRLAALRSALVSIMKNNNNNNNNSSILSKGNGSYTCRGENSDSLFECHLCDHSFPDTTSLEQHLSLVHSRDVTYKCGICGFVCQWNNLYIEHLKEHFPGPPYKCDSCDFTCDKLNSILTHRFSHVQNKLHKCSHCDFRSKSQANVKMHSKCHINDALYMALDKNENPFEDKCYMCDLCGFSSKETSHLLAHKKIHYSEDAYRYASPKKAQVLSHGKSHQGVRPHSCSVCGRGFLEKSHLVRHERIHLEEKPFKCYECDYASSRRDKLKEHQARHHGDNASAKVPYKPRSNKKTNQGFPESFSDSGKIVQQTEIAESVIQNQLIPSNLNSYVGFGGNEIQVQPSTGSVLDFHHQQLANSTNARMKEHSAGCGTGSRPHHQSSAAAVAAAMMLDSRFHQGNGGSVSPYSASPVSVSTMVNPTTSQILQSGHQMNEYPSALMSLF